MASGDVGPVFEWREYMMRADGQPALVENWASAIEERVKMSPLVMAMVTETGALNKFVHIWGYESLEHRRESARRGPVKGNLAAQEHQRRTRPDPDPGMQDLLRGGLFAAAVGAQLIRYSWVVN